MSADESSDRAGRGGTRSKLKAKRQQSVLDDLRGSVFLKRKFGVGVKVVAKFNHWVVRLVE
jgi:hypothetical protein